jgi:hypothetical protein
MGPVRCAERIVHEHIGEMGEAICRCGAIGRFPGFKSGVLKDDDRARGRITDRMLDVRSDHPWGQHNVEPPDLPEALRDRAHRKLGVNPIGPAQMARHDHATRWCAHLCDRRKAGANPKIVEHLTTCKRHVQIRPNQCGDTRQIKRFERW